MPLACGCGKHLDLIGLPEHVTSERDPVVIGAALRMGWRIRAGVVLCADCSVATPTPAPAAATEPAPPLLAHESARAACRPHLLKALGTAEALGVELGDLHVFTLDELTGGAS